VKFFIGYDGEGFESAKKETVIASESIAAAIDYASGDLKNGFIASFQIYDEQGSEIFSFQGLEVSA
jgi:hypothetical protein